MTETKATLAVPAHRVVSSGPGADRPAGPVAVEEPLEIRFGPKLATVLMRTPGHDEELVLGFLFTEGIIRKLADVRGLARPSDLLPGEVGNVIAVEYPPSLQVVAANRTFYSTASCGVCGKNSLAALEIRAPACTSPLRVPATVVQRVPLAMRVAQKVFQETGGTHAAAMFTNRGALVVQREDVGRHNALDKVVGWALRENRLPLDDHVLVVSGRVSYEIVQKAIAAGIPFIVAIGAPSSLAVELAVRFGLTLVGFTRPTSFNVYAGAERITGV